MWKFRDEVVVNSVLCGPQDDHWPGVVNCKQKPQLRTAHAPGSSVEVHLPVVFNIIHIQPRQCAQAGGSQHLHPLWQRAAGPGAGAAPGKVPQSHKSKMSKAALLLEAQS